MTAHPNLRRPLICALLALVALPALGSSATAASAPTGPYAIEGVWSFSGGAVGVQGLSNKTFQGTVVNPTTFATCEHPTGQVMWTDMRPQADGSFLGLHQWFHGPNCEADPELGLTAWRVLVAADGTRRLKVCFSIPGDSAQPTIAPDGKEANASYGCTESSPLAPLPGSKESQEKVSFTSAVSVPPAKECLSRHSLKIVLHSPKYEPLKEVVVRINGKKVIDINGPERLKKSILLKKLPERTFKVSILAVTVLNHRLVGSRTYHSCTQGPGKIKVPGAKSHRH